MEWYSGSGIEDLVPKSEEFPDSWFKWGTNAPQCFESGNMYFTTDLDSPREELNFNGKRSIYYDDEMGASVNSKDHSLQQSAFSQGQPDYQLDNYPGFEHTDDIFLSSLLDDLPVKALQLGHSSLEESILQGLEIVMTQLTEKSRICFRDALYRLASNSKQDLVDGSLTDDPLMKEPLPLTTHDETIRHDITKPVLVLESETNTIDRAIANLIFGEMESNARNISSVPETQLE